MRGELLISKCQKGDRQAQKCLYDTYASYMYRLCCRYIKNQYEAEDVLIKGFHKVLIHITNFEYRDEAGLVAWMKRIMVNECLMMIRKANNFNLIPLTEEMEVPVEVPPDNQLLAEDIYALILELPANYRTVFNLYVIEGYTHKEVAAQLQISELASRSLLSKAKGLLRTLLLKNNLNYAV